MATLNGNDYYLVVDSVDVSAYTTSLSLSKTVGDENTTAGAGTEWEEHAPKLSVIDLSFTVVYDTTNIGTYLDHIAPSTVITIVAGTESNTAGKPKHEGSFLVTSTSGPEQNVEKTTVKFEVTAKSNGTPVTNMYANGTF